MARSTLPPGFAQHDFLKLMKKDPNPRNRFRLLAMHHLQQGKTLTAIAEIVQCHWKTVQAWLHRFRQSGFDGLLESPRSGAPQKITGEAEEWLHDKLKTLSESKTGGYITGQELQDLLVEHFGIKCTLKTVYNTLHRLGFSWITSRSMHPKSNPDVQEAYKKTSQHS